MHNGTCLDELQRRSLLRRTMRKALVSSRVRNSGMLIFCFSDGVEDNRSSADESIRT